MKRKSILFLIIIVMLVGVVNVPISANETLNTAPQNYVHWMEYSKSNSTGIPTVADDGVSISVGEDTYVVSSVGKTGGKWYWEVEVGDKLLGKIGFLMEDDVNKNIHYGYIPANRKFIQYLDTSQRITYRGSDPYAKTGDIVRYLVDVDNKIMTLYLNSYKLIEVSTRGGLLLPAIVTGKGDGITAKANFGSTAFKYDIPEGYLPFSNSSVHDKDVNVSEFSIFLSTGETTQLAVTSLINNNLNYTWSSTKNSVATVNSSGLVTAKGVGKTQITAVNKSGTISLAINIIVNELSNTP